MTTFARGTRLIAAAGVAIVTTASAQSSPKASPDSARSPRGSAKSTQGSTKSKQASPKSEQGATKSVEGKALQTRVWVNKDSKVYHCPASLYYGKTRNGEFMEEAQARGYGNRAVQGQGCNNVATKGAAPLPMATNAAMRMVWVNTESGVYHCPNSSEWGVTRRGRYLTESDASVSGHRPATGKKCGAR
jgi:hypothetical protein